MISSSIVVKYAKIERVDGRVYSLGVTGGPGHAGCGAARASETVLNPATHMNQSLRLALVLALLPIVAALTPQWRGLINGTVIYIVFGCIALCFFVCISKSNRP